MAGEPQTVRQNKEEAMDIEKLQDFFFWCMLVNSGIYAFTAIAVLVLRDLVCKIHRKMFGLDEKTVCKSIHMYLAVFCNTNLTPVVIQF